MTQRLSPFMWSKRPRRGKKDPADPQAHRVYRMERRIAGWAIYAHVELDDLQRISDYICRKYGVKRVSIVIENQNSRVFGWFSGNSIHLNADFHGDNTAVLTHELAHYITDELYPGEPSHGPSFVYVYGEILDRLNLFPIKQFYEMCNDFHVSLGLSNTEDET